MKTRNLLDAPAVIPPPEGAALRPAPSEPGPISPDWRCQRTGPISGSYAGPSSDGSEELVLRIDVDPLGPNAPVMNRISGDLHRLTRFQLPGRPPARIALYRESWIVDEPVIEWGRCSAVIRGRVRYFKNRHPTTDVEVRVRWGSLTGPAGATVTFTVGDGTTRSFECARQGRHLRSIELELDVCRSVEGSPLSPAYDTMAHAVRPPDTARRALTVAGVYAEAGIELVVPAERSVIDDSAATFSSWSPAELHEAMASAYGRIGGDWPGWRMWGLLAGRYEDPAVAGVMFDAAADFGGAGQAPERQGFAVFRDHAWFADLPAGAPATQAEARALRDYLYTWVHEAGHAFNLLHSWNKGRASALSWMNYPSRYDHLHGRDAFWRAFPFRFDDEELVHMRHGDRGAVIMGGDPWSSGGHLDDGTDAHLSPEGDLPLELLVRTRGTYELLEDVRIEVRLRNLLPDVAMPIDGRLDPAYGNVRVFIQGPGPGQGQDDRIREFAPVVTLLGEPEVHELAPAAAPGAEKDGADRLSAEISLSYGKGGFFFERPGNYRLRVIYYAPGGLVIPSRLSVIRVLAPRDCEQDRLAADYFTKEVGMVLALGGSASPRLRRGMDMMSLLWERYEGQGVGAQAASILAATAARGFHGVEGGRLSRRKAEEPELALALSEGAMRYYEATPSPRLNLAYARLARQRGASLAGLGRQEEARREMARVLGQLEARGVKARARARLAQH